MNEVGTAWPLRSEHSGALLRLRRLIANRRSFTLCFLPYSDSAYRDIAAAFLAELLGARLRVAIDRDIRIGTEDLFERLSDQAHDGPVQLSGLERWPDGLDNLLQRLNYRREALAARCRRPVLAWIRNRDVAAVATGAADLWAWRSGVFDFTLPASADRVDPLPTRIDLPSANEPARRDRLDELQRFLRTRSPLRPVDVDLLLELGDLQRSIGRPEEAERSYSRALTALASMDDRRRRAIARGRIADLLEARGELDEALRIRTEDQLPVYEHLGDMRLIAITKGRIADILQMRGELDEALRIRTEEELPVYERLGDVRSLTITRGQIADILETRGELDEALRIRTEEELPVYERLGDTRSAAITKGQIADILQMRGELDEALRIRTDEQLPAFERLGDTLLAAITKGQIADILQMRGELNEALRIHTDEQLPVFDRLRAARSAAITKGRIADILQTRGELKEALRIRAEEQLPVFDRMGDARSAAITKGRIADILQTRGELEEALRIRAEEQLPVFERMGDTRSVAITKGRIADILQTRGELDEALRIRTNDELPVYERLGDARSAAITKGQIADILQMRGELDGALRIRTNDELPVYERLEDARVRRRSPRARSPTSCRRAASWTRRCASAPMRRFPSTSAWETSSRWPRPRRRSRNFGRRSHERHHRREASGTSRQRLALCRLSRRGRWHTLALAQERSSDGNAARGTAQAAPDVRPRADARHPVPDPGPHRLRAGARLLGRAGCRSAGVAVPVGPRRGVRRLADRAVPAAPGTL